MGGLSSAVFYGAGKAVEALKRGIRKVDYKSIDVSISEDIRTGVAQKDTGIQIGKNMFSSREDLRDTIIHEELHHRWWKKGIFNHHPRYSYKEERFYETIEKYMRMRGWKK